MAAFVPDALTFSLLCEWKAHRARKPAAYEDDYAINVDHLRIAADEWARVDMEYRHLIGDRLAEVAVRQLEAT